jgi:hypothetical protein
LSFGQVGCCLVVEIDDVAEIDGRSNDRLVLAKLPIGGLQVGKIDAAERLALADLLEIDVLDVEGLEHMRAARAQQQRDLRLILCAIEPGLHRTRSGRDLTERQCGGENLDEKRFHPAGPRSRGPGFTPPA